MASIFTSFFCLSSLLLLGIQITSFTQADLTSRNVQYIHSSESEKHTDAFSFTLSDGVNEVGEKLHSLLEKANHRAVCRATGAIRASIPPALSQGQRQLLTAPGALAQENSHLSSWSVRHARNDVKRKGGAPTFCLGRAGGMCSSNLHVCAILGDSDFPHHYSPCGWFTARCTELGDAGTGGSEKDHHRVWAQGRGRRHRGKSIPPGFSGWMRSWPADSCCSVNVYPEWRTEWWGQFKYPWRTEN